MAIVSLINKIPHLNYGKKIYPLQLIPEEKKDLKKIEDKEIKDNVEILKTKKDVLSVEQNIKYDSFECEEYEDELPSAFSRKDQMNASENQGPRSTCVTFSMLAQHEYNWSKRRTFSKEFLYWDAQKRSDGPEVPAISIYQAWTALLNKGVCLEKDWPYNLLQPFPIWEGPNPPENAIESAFDYKVRKGYFLDSLENVGTVDLLKDLMYRKGYVISFMSALWDSAWPKTGIVRMPSQKEKDAMCDKLYDLLVYMYPELKKDYKKALTNPKYLAYHSICLCGWNDDDPYSIPPEFEDDLPEEIRKTITVDPVDGKKYARGRFIFKNSWKHSWGIDGYGSIPYAYVENWGRDFFIFQSLFSR